MPLSKEKKNKLRKLMGVPIPQELPDYSKDIQTLKKGVKDTQINLSEKINSLSDRINNLPVPEIPKLEPVEMTPYDDTPLKQMIASQLDDVALKLKNYRIEALQHGGGSMNRQIRVEGVNVLTRYTDINLYGTTSSVISSTDNTNKRVNIGIQTSGVNGVALTKTDDTNVTLTLGGSPSAALVNATSLTLGWTGTLGVSRGGTGTTKGTVITLFDHFVDAGNTTTNETDLYSDTTAAGQLTNNGDKLEVEYGGVFVSSGTATREVKIYFGGSAIFDTGALTLSLSAAWTAFATIIRVDAATVRYMISFTTEGAALAAYTAVGSLGSLTLANTNILKVTGQAAGVGAATNDIVAKLGSVSFVPAA